MAEQTRDLTRWIGAVLLTALLALVLASVLLPSSGIGWMRHRWLWFTLPLDWIEGTRSAVNLVHLILFLPLGAAVRLALPRWGAGRMVLALTLLGIGTELAQFLVPGRHPRMSDVLVDVVAGVVGWGAAHAVLRRR